jgi:hypothetical protein
MAGEVGITDKPEMGLKAGRGEGLAQTRDAAGNATGPGILVRPFKAEEMKLHKVLFLRVQIATLIPRRKPW